MTTGSIETQAINEIRVTGPFQIESADLRSVSWIAKLGSIIVGSVKLVREPGHVATIRDLHVSGDACQAQEIATKLIEQAAESARDHGVLKLKVDRNTSHYGVRRTLLRVGFKDAATRPNERTPMQFYLDLYHQVQKRERRPEVSKGTQLRMAC